MTEQHIKLTVDVLVFAKEKDEWQILMVKRGRPPFEGHWSFPSGFVEDDEELDVAAMRELNEETGVQLKEVRQLHAFGKVTRDPRGRTVSVTHYAIVDGKQDAKGGDDAAEAQWVYVKDIQTADLAFDHKEILSYALEELGDELI